MGQRIRCKKCDSIIESKHVHDYVSCDCGAIAIDGGDQHTRLGFPGEPMDYWIEFLPKKEEKNEKI